jgi:beta-barrel assembly-enhancing protease
MFYKTKIIFLTTLLFIANFFTVSNTHAITKKGLAITGLVVGGTALGVGLYKHSQKKHEEQIYKNSPQDVGLLEQKKRSGLFQISEAQEIQIGQQAAAEVEKKQRIIRDEIVQNYITQLGNKLVKSSQRPNLAYTFRIVDDKQVNAFALPGGYIFINRGLIQQAGSENELVGAIAHEIGHVAARHSAEQIAKATKTQIGLGVAGAILGNGVVMNGASLLAQGAFLKFGRDAEREADRLGAVNMHQAGWDASGMVSLLKRLENLSSSRTPTFFSDHPSPKEREANISDLIANWGNSGTIDSNQFQEIKKRLI